MAVKRSGKSYRKLRGPSKRTQIFLTLLLVAAIAAVTYNYRNALQYYLTDSAKIDEEEKLHAIRNFQVLTEHDGMSFGFDVSEYQGEINWLQTDSIEKTFPVDFVFIRATAGRDRPDHKFAENWVAAKKQGLIRGAYHYYRPDENSLEQAALFIKTVRIENGDLPPVLDIEKIPEEQSIDSLKVGLRRWLNKIENHYGVKPIIYTGERYFSDFLEDEFGEDYNFWIANYNFFVEEIDNNWTFWQFTERGRIPGIDGNSDVNIFNGNLRELRKMTVRR